MSIPSLSSLCCNKKSKKMSVTARALNARLTLYPSGRVVKNRFMKAATSEGTATYDQDDALVTGVPTPAIINAYEKWAAGKWGLIVTGGIAIDTFGINYLPGNMWIGEKEDCPKRRKAFSDLAKAVHKHDGTLIGQVLNIEDGMAYLAADHASAAQLSRTIYAAKYLAESGFDGIELGTPEPPKDKAGKPDVRKVLELVDFQRTVIRTALPSQTSEKFIFGLKVSTARMQQAGVDFDGIVKILQQAESSGYDYVAIAGGNYENPLSTAEDRESLYRRVIDEGRQHLGLNIAVYGNGGFRSVAVIDDLIYARKLNGVAMAKAACAEFDLPLKVAQNSVKSAVKNPFEFDNDSAVLAGAAQINQAGAKTLKESKGVINDGVMDLNNSATMKQFLEAKEDYLSRKQKLKDDGRFMAGVVTLSA
uniref:Oxidored_FMN domain-containing protein n=1 Tax=Panagrellus redivivus TaxID=6233 RepID=A0A7E4VKW6_PANRE